jgi:hypothetical protein
MPAPGVKAPDERKQEVNQERDTRMNRQIIAPT